MKTIMLATDGSPSAESALDLAISLCHDTGARLDVLTVRTREQHGDGAAIHGDHMDVQPVVEGIAADATDRARLLGVDATAHTAFGTPASAIADTAAALGADLVIVGSRGRGSLAGALVGSVSRGLISSCEIPLTIVRAPSGLMDRD